MPTLKTMNVLIRVAEEPTRRESIDVLRRTLRGFARTDASICRVAGELGIFCRGFRRWSAAEFDRRWHGPIGRSTHLSRAQMERFADIWQLTEQLCRGVSLACDAATGDGSPCRGWDEFSNEDLARFRRELEANGAHDRDIGDGHDESCDARS